MKYDPLVFGKDQTERIVNIEIQDDQTILFIQDDEGNITQDIKPNRFWLLADKQIDKSWVKLDGDLHYKYGRQFANRFDFTKYRAIYNKNNDVFSIWNAQESCMVKDGYTYFKGMQPKDISLMSLDIETTGLNPQADDALILAISTTYRVKDKIIKKSFYYDQFKSQKELLIALTNHIKVLNPSLVIGHNIISFDLVYMNGIAEKEGITLDWGRDGSAITFESRESKFRLDGTRDLHYHNCLIFGREIVDTYFLSIKYDVARSMETYGLKPLIIQLGLESPGRTYYDASKIKNNYKIQAEWEKIKAYCKDDADDPIKLWDLMGPLFFFTTQMVPKTFTKVLLSASGSQINSMMVRSYLQEKHSIPKASETRQFEGALSWGRPGIYNNVLKVDVSAQYPSIILQYKVFDKQKDPKANVLKLVQLFRQNRLEYKRLAAETNLQSYKDMDTAAKGILNSFYGFYAATGLNFNSPDSAEFITAKGREILNQSIIWATGKDFKEVAPDYYLQKAEEENED